MTHAIDGLWWLDFMSQPHRKPFGNEFVLSGGIVSTIGSGRQAGTYQIEPGLLTISLPMPTIPDEGPWRVEAKFQLLDPSNPPDRMRGVLQAFDASETVTANETCALVRRALDA